MARMLHLIRVPTRHRALHDHMTTEAKDPACDRPLPARCSRRNASALRSCARRGARRRCCVCQPERRACLQAPICRNGSAAPRWRWRPADHRGAHHGPALTPDRQIRRCRDGRGGCCRSIGRYTKTVRRQVRHDTSRAAVGTLAGATLLFLQARLNCKNNHKPATSSKVSDPRLTSKGGRARRW